MHSNYSDFYFINLYKYNDSEDAFDNELIKKCGS